MIRLIQNDQSKTVNTPSSSPPTDRITPPRKPAAAAAPVLNVFFVLTTLALGQTSYSKGSRNSTDTNEEKDAGQITTAVATGVLEVFERKEWYY